MFTARTLAGPAGLNPLKALQGPTFLGSLARLLTRLADRLEQHGEARRRERQRRDTERALYGLDPRVLRDIGCSPSEITSIAAEAAGEIEATRLRVMGGLPHDGHRRA